MADFRLKDGTEYLPGYNWEPAMNDELAYSDRAGYTTSVAMLTTGRPEDWDMFSGPEVGPSNYELDPMGEERRHMTFEHEDGGPHALGHIGMMTTEDGAGPQENSVPATTSGGKSTHLAPQNYSRLQYPGKK